MYELIKIENTPSVPSLRDTTIGGESVPTVNARELHEFLDVTTRFNDWITKRIKDYSFIENQDFLTFTENSVKGQIGRPVKEYHMSLDMAKELAMVERNEKGREARKYFIQCEKELRQQQVSEEKYILDIVMANSREQRASALGDYRDNFVKPLIEFKEQALPKVSYYDNVLASPDLVTITQIAKEDPRRAPLSSKQSFFTEYCGMTAIDFNKLLESLNIQYKQSGQWLLYHAYAKEGYTQSSTYLTECGYSKLTTKWTQKGRLFIYEMLKSKGILPICESPEGDMN